MTTLATWPHLSSLRFSQNEVDDRTRYLGASDLYRIRRGTWRRLWLEKTGRRKPDDLSGVTHVQLGLWCEEFARQWAERELDIQVDRSGLGRLYTDATLPWRAAHHDGITTLPDGRMAVFEAKHTTLSPEAVLDAYRPQLHHEMACLGTDVALLFAIHTDPATRPCCGWSCEQVQLDPAFMATVTLVSTEFWNHVVTDTEPQDRKGPLF